MNALGRGLASLIPRRGSRSAESIIEEIDEESERVADEVSDTNEGVTAVAPDEALELTLTTKSTTVTVMDGDEDEDIEDEEVADTATPKQVNVFEEFEQIEEMESEPMPAPPNVTPLTIDPETGAVVEVVTAEMTPAAVKAEAVIVEPVPATTQQPAAEAVGEETIAKQPAPLAKEQPVTKRKRIVKQPITEPVGAGVASRVLGEEVRYLALGDIEVNPFQPRQQFDEQELADLSQSLEQHGMLQPLVVMEKDDGTGYQLLAGERRLRAARELKWDEVPVVVRSDVRGDRHRLELALTENVQRQNLNPIEEAMGYQQLNEEFGMSHEEIGMRVGRSRVAITNIMRVLQLPAEIQRGLIEGRISTGHAKAILMIPDEEKQLRFYNHVLEEGLTVRKTENRARNIQRQMNLSDPMRKKTRGRPQVALKYDGMLQEKFGHNARIKFLSTKNRFEIVFHAYTEDEATELAEKLLGLRALPHNVDQDVLED